MQDINKTVVHEEPKIIYYQNVFDRKICDDIIAWGREKTIPGGIVSSDTALSKVDTSVRDASVVVYGEGCPHYEHLSDTVSKLTGIDKSRFEPFSVTNYKKGQHFKLHQDFFIEGENEEYEKNTVKRCDQGGNRLYTVIIYLNDVELGGETSFPWVQKLVKPEAGAICQFNYDYDDPKSNMKTQHTALPVIDGEKWIITVWIREKPLTEKVIDYKKFEVESKYYTDLKDVKYTLTCGPDWDQRTLSLTLPRNNSPENAIAIGVTGGMESSLLLYLIAVLNTFQKIPYTITPMMIASDIEDGVPVHNECLYAADRLRDILNERLAPHYIRPVSTIVPDRWDEHRLDSGYAKVFMKSPKASSSTRYLNYKYLFLGTNELPTDDDPRWANINFKRRKSVTSKVVQPFFNLQKYHIIDAIIKLGLEELFEIVGHCSRNHPTLTENCEFFACNERRWGFDKLGKQDLGHKYFTVKGDKT